jgi:hypothetical protein
LSGLALALLTLDDGTGMVSGWIGSRNCFHSLLYGDGISVSVQDVENVSFARYLDLYAGWEGRIVLIPLASMNTKY